MSLDEEKLIAKMRHLGLSEGANHLRVIGKIENSPEPWQDSLLRHYHAMAVFRPKVQQFLRDMEDNMKSMRLVMLNCNKKNDSTTG